MGTFNACISADLVHRLRTCLDRLLTTGHVVKVKEESAWISQASICASNSHAPVVAGLEQDLGQASTGAVQFRKLEAGSRAFS
jgi:hypothetical protein